MRILSRTTPAAIGSLALLLMMALADLAHATRDLLVSNPTTNSILRFDGTTGTAKGTFVASQAGGLTLPQQMAIGPDGNLYVADGTANTVKRYSILDGSFLGDFTPVGDLLSPIALKFFDDGINGLKLYVLGGSTQRRINRYNLDTGDKEASVVVTTSTILGTGRDFLFMEGTNDVLIVGSNNKGVRFQLSTTLFISNFINPTGVHSILNSPSNILYGPDGNIWISSSTGNKITRFNPATGAKIDDIISGVPLSNGPYQMQFEGSSLFVANGAANNIIRYPLTNGTPGGGELFIAANSQGMTAPQFILFADIDIPPAANAGADVSVGIGQQFSLNGSGSSDPEGVALTYAWTQLSGPTVLPGPLVVSGSATTATLDILAPDAPVPLVFQLTVSDGVRTASDTVTVQVTAPPTETWRYQYFTSIYNTGNAADSADPDHDGLVNLLERAFNLDPTLAGQLVLTADTGTSGLPLVRATDGPAGRVFSIQYLRRKASANPGLTYTPQFSSSLDGEWSAATGTETVESIDAEWERVTVEEDATGQPVRFGRVRVVSGE
jgi:sugar lactone lactonase YvrE